MPSPPPAADLPRPSPPRPPDTGGIAALLWDADGVLQHGPAGWNWRDEVDRFGGPGFSRAVYLAERPALTGARPLEECLGDVLEAWPHVPLTVDDLIGLWEMASVDPAAFAYVTELRARGIPCHLGSNQQDHRRAWMRDAWGYDDHFDRSFYSCEMGVAKPDPRFFTMILDDLGLAAHEVGFIDDKLANVASAAAVGMPTYHHPRGAGVEVLRAGVEDLLTR